MRMVSKDLDYLDDQANALNDELQFQSGMIDEVSTKMTKTEQKFSQLNEKMRGRPKRKRNE